jgi:hypothetical protein
LKFLLSFTQLIVYSNVWVALCAATLTGATPCAVGQGFSWISFALVFSATLGAYNFQRLSRLDGTAGDNESAMVMWLLKHRALVVGLIALAGVGTVLSLFFLRWEILLLLAPLALISVAYSVRLSFQKGGSRGLRDIPGIKIFLIAVTWVGATYVLPSVQVDGVAVLEEPAFWIRLIDRFLFVLAITLPFDIRDVKFDHHSKKTIPQLVGSKVSVVIALACLAGSAMLYLSLAPNHLIEENGILKITGAYLLVFLLIAFSNTKKPDLYYTGAVEGASIILGVGYWVTLLS